jgi:hypothetical protein
MRGLGRWNVECGKERNGFQVSVVRRQRTDERSQRKYEFEGGKKGRGAPERGRYGRRNSEGGIFRFWILD